MSSPIEQNTPSAAYWGPLGPYLPDFLDYLRSAGLSEKKARDALGQARHFLLWLKQVELDIESIDDVVLRRFRDHDCRCPRPRYGQYGSYTRRPRTVLSGARRLIQFFEELGITRHPGECSTGFRLLEAFLSQLERDRYRPDTLTHYRGLCRHFIVWLHHSRIAMKELDAPVLDRFIHHDCLCHGFCRKRPGAADNRVAIERFAGFLAAHGVVPDAHQASAGTGDEELPAFGTWLRRYRGIQETTIRGYAREIGILLQEFDVSPEHYDAKRVRDVLMCRFGQISRSHAKKVAISMRMYLRFLATIGACAPGLIGAVPTVRSWRLASLPRYRPPDEIGRVVSACNTATAVGLRDRAILLLLARLALRAGDVAGLRLGDIVGAVRRLAIWLHAEDPRHEIPPRSAIGRAHRSRPAPHLLTPDQIRQVMAAALSLPPAGSLTPHTYHTMIGLIASTGLRASEACALQVGDWVPDGVIIRETKFRKRRLVVLHESTRNALARYLKIRKQQGGSSDELFVLATGKPPARISLTHIFIKLARQCGLRGGPGEPGPRLHDLRHAFAVRSLEQAVATNRDSVNRHILALGTYLGHVNASSTYWYLEATPTLLRQIAECTENAHARRVV